MSKQDIEKRLGFAAQGVKDIFAADWLPQISQMLKYVSSERHRVTMWISSPTTVKVAGAYRQSKSPTLSPGAAIPSNVATYLYNAAGIPNKYNYTFKENSPKEGQDTLIITVDGLPAEIVSYLKAWGIGSSPKSFAGFKGSRPGAKAKFATEVGRKGNKSAMISRDATGTYYAYVVQRIETGIGKAEDMLGTMRAYSTEDRAKRAAIKALDTSGFTAARHNAKKASTDFDLAEACWEGYEAVGTKKKDGKTVPNCVPKKKAARPGVKAKFGTDSISVNMIAKRMVSKLKKIVPNEGLEQFHKRLLARINEIVKSTEEAIRNPDDANLQWTIQELKDVIRDEAGSSGSLNRATGVWLGSRPGVKAKA
jgi:hypothetical protein